MKRTIKQRRERGIRLAIQFPHRPHGIVESGIEARIVGARPNSGDEEELEQGLQQMAIKETSKNSKKKGKDLKKRTVSGG